MSGHSKWKTIKHKKGAADAKKGKIFTRHSKLIAIAAKNGGDPDMNPALKIAIVNAKADGVPNDNVDRAVKKGSGNDKDAGVYTEAQYEGYAPGGIAVIIETLTDNTNRTIMSVRNIVSKAGGNLGNSGSVAWMFDDKGHMEITIGGASQETLEMDIIESGAEDMDFGEETVEITTGFEDLASVRSALEAKGYTVQNVRKKKVPKNLTPIEDAKAAERLFAFIEKIEEDDDVSIVYHNASISDEILESLQEE